MFRKGHRLFSVASIGLILVAVFHAITHFSAPPEELLASGLLVAMQTYRLDLGLGNPSMMEIHESLSLCFSIMTLWAGMLNLMVARYTVLRDKLMRRVCTLNVVIVGGLVALFSNSQMLIPAISLGIVEILFIIARIRLRRSRIVH